MFLRPHPSSPLSTISYTNTTIHTPDNAQPAIDPTSLKTPLKTMQHTAAHGSTGGGGGAAFPPALGSSSPPMSSPTSYRDSQQTSFYLDGSSSRTQRGGQSSAGMFAARARALQPPLQRSSSLVQGSGSSASTMDNQQFRYGRRPGMRKSMTGGSGYGDSSSQASNSTGYSLFYKPVQTSSQESLSARSTSSRRNVSVPSMPPPPPAAAPEQSIQGTLWKGRFRQRCLASSRRREENDGMSDAQEGEDNEAEEAEHEEIFRRMIQKEQRKQAHRIAVSFEQEVGGSDPAVWEAEVREAEALGDSSPSVKEGDMKVTGGTPRKPLDTLWQYRSATKPFQREHSSQNLRSSTNGLMNSPAEQYGVTGDYQDNEQEAREEAEQYAAFLQAQADEDRLLAEYADIVAPTAHIYGQSPANGPPQVAAGHSIDGAADSEVEEPAVDTPGAELGIEMQGFTWEDAPLSDEDGNGEGGTDVEMA